MCKSRSDNVPHIFAVADCAYQDVLHHEEPQHIILSGESHSGKTTNMMHLLKQLLWIGKVGRQGNFHLFYYFYDAIVARKELEKYNLESGRRHRYLRSVTAPNGGAPANTVASDPAATNNNVRSFENFEAALRNLEFSDDGIKTIKNMLAAILVLGELRFRDGGDGKAEIENPRVASSVASLLSVDEKKLSWAMVNYCVVECGQAEKRRQSPEEAEEARDAFARALYSRLADWIVNSINLKLSFTRAVFILDLFGFECFQRNNLEQLIVNSLNEQLQYHYTQRLFAWEMQEREEEEVSNVAERLTYYNNRPTVDLLMAKPEGIVWLVDEATRKQQGAPFIVESLRKVKSTFCQTSANDNEFSVAHYTGKVTYDARDFYDKNRDFVPPEVTETMRLSNNSTIKEIFTNPLTRTGNLTQSKLDVAAAEAAAPNSGEGRPRRNSKWSAALLSDKQRHANRGYNTVSRGQFSQTRRMRTTTATFRAVCLELLRSLNNGGTHFVRCVRAELTGQPRGFQAEVVRQQMRALGVLDTVRARQGGFPCRVHFSEYKFLAFDFDETVDETGDNCRLLMVRLKMEGYAMGKTKVFLKYYNEEFLARLYEVQVKKIVKVQAMMRSFLAKRRVGQAGPKTPGALAGLGSSKDEGNDAFKDGTEEIEVPRSSRFRNPLASVLDYLEDDDDEPSDQ
ncbi:hypothetical protein B566_EDAN005269 [Ephemera danica]|nr:hypothetical protein B566_EDAN005269 [Ephemera danica]